MCWTGFVLHKTIHRYTKYKPPRATPITIIGKLKDPMMMNIITLPMKNSISTSIFAFCNWITVVYVLYSMVAGVEDYETNYDSR